MDAFGSVQTVLPWWEGQPHLLTTSPDQIATIPGYFPEDPTDNPYHFDEAQP